MKRLALLLFLLLPVGAFAGGLAGPSSFNISSAVEGVCIDITGGTTVNVDEACSPTWTGPHTFTQTVTANNNILGSNAHSDTIDFTSGSAEVFMSASADAVSCEMYGLDGAGKQVYDFYGDTTDHIFDMFALNGTTKTIHIDAVTGNVQGKTLESTIATGTAPLTVASTTKVTNLNADTVDGIDSTAFAQKLSGTSGSIGGGALAAGACASATVAISGATTAMVAFANPSSNDATLDSCIIKAYVSAADTVTVQVCETVIGTPAAKTYLVRVIK